MSNVIQLPDGFVKTPSQAKTATNDNFVTSEDLHKPEEYPELIPIYGNQRISDMVEFLGGFKPVAQTSYTHTEDTFIHVFVKAQAASAPTSGQTDTAFTVNSNYITSSNHPIRQGDVLLCDVSKQRLLVVSTNATTFTAQPYEDWRFTSAQDGVDVSFVVIGRENTEGGSTPSTYLSPRASKITNNVMIIDDAYQWTGTEGTNQTWVEVEDASGKRGFLWYYKGQNDHITRFKNYSEMMMLLGQKATGDTLSDGYRGTEGMIDAVENRGQVMDLAGNAITMADVDALTRSLDKYKGAKENAWFAGFDLRTDVSDLLAGQNAAISGKNFGAFQNSDELMINLDFDGFTRNGYKFAMKTYNLFNQADLLGFDGFDYSGWGIIAPMDKVTSRSAAGDAIQSNEKVPSLCVRYKEAGGNSRKMETWLTGGTAGTYTNKTDAVDLNCRTERGFQLFGANRFALIKK